MTGQFQIEL